MIRNMPRNREAHTRPENRERLVAVKLMVPKSAVEQMKELEHDHQHTKEDIFLAGIQVCREHGA